jgi:hypothetical protein
MSRGNKKPVSKTTAKPSRASKGTPSNPSGTQLNKKQEVEKQVFLTDEELTEIWELLGTLPADEAAAFLNEFPPEVIEKIRTAKNPYKLPVFKGRDNRLLICTVLPLAERYCQRFTMTSLIGFIFRMVDEYKPKSLDHLPKEDDPSFQTVFAKHIKKLEIDRPFKEFESRIVSSQTKIAELQDLIVTFPDRTLEDPINLIDGLPTPRSFDMPTLTTKLALETKTLMECQAGVLLLKYSNKYQDISNLEVKLIGMTKKVDETGMIVKSVTENIKRFTVELGCLEELYTAQPGAEPAEEPEGFPKVRGEESDAKPNKNRKTIRSAIEHYSAKLIEYETSYGVALAQKLEIEQRIATLKSETTDIKKNQLEELSKKYFAAYGNPNGKTPDLVKQAKKRADPNRPVKAALKQKKTTKTKTPWHNVFEHVIIDEFELTDADYIEARRLSKLELGIAKTYEEKVEKQQTVLSDFLQEYFRYNPDNHVSCAYKPNYEDPSRTPLEQDELRVSKETEYERSLVPPDDTFFRWQRYVDNNYEALRQATDDIYCEKSDLELNIVPMEVVEDDDPDAAREKALAFCRKYRKEFEAEPKVVSFRVNNLLGSWQQNRERIDFYNENTEVVKRIIEQHQKDSKLGPELMKDRIERKRDKQIQVAGKEDTGFQDFRKAMPGSLETLGAKHASEILEKDIPKDRKAAGKKELEVGVHVIKPVRHGRRIYGRTKQSHFNIAAHDQEGEVGLTTAEDAQKAFVDSKL